MDEELRRRERLHDTTRASLLRARSGDVPGALDALEARWREGDEGAREVFFDLVGKAPREERLRHAARLDALAHDGFAEAEALWRSWVPAALHVVGKSAAVRRLRAFIYEHAHGDEPLLLCGESGVGHELAARTIHEISGRGPWFATPFLRELARTPRGATLFVPDVAAEDLNYVLATARDRHARLILGADASERPTGLTRFEIAPLRDYVDEDGALLARHFLDKHGAHSSPLTREMTDLIARCAWPGNVRMLDYALRRVAQVHSTEPLERLAAQYPR